MNLKWTMAIGVMVVSGIGVVSRQHATPNQSFNRQTTEVRKRLALPAAAQPVVSATLGRHDARYGVHAQEGRIDVSNPAHTLKAEFDQRGVEVRTGGARWRMALAGYGYGTTLRTPRAGRPQPKQPS